MKLFLYTALLTHADSIIKGFSGFNQKTLNKYYVRHSHICMCIYIYIHIENLQKGVNLSNSISYLFYIIVLIRMR